MLSIIIPVYNEAENIEPLLKELYLYSEDNTEYIFVDDGSKDYTLTIIEQFAEKDSRVKCISLSRNFGHQNALMAGMQHCNGHNIIIMDADLQHPPAMIPKLLKELEHGYDLVQTKRISTKDISPGKALLSNIFYSFICE
ncbi:MAG: glycosyltransferase family 2 protein [Ferruginibacter sp.]